MKQHKTSMAVKNIIITTGVFLLVLFVNICYAQSWIRNQGANYTTGDHIIKLIDGGYFVTGSTSGIDSAQNNTYILKTDSLGYMQWQHTIGGADMENGVASVQVNSGEIYTLTRTRVQQSYISFLHKISIDGNLLWSKQIIGGNFVATSLLYSNGGLNIAGSLIDSITTSDFLMIKADTSGNVIWMRQLAIQGIQAMSGAISMPDKGFVLYGNQDYNLSGYRTAYVVRTDSLGDTLWTRSYSNIFTSNSYPGMRCGALLSGDTILAFGGTVTAYIGEIRTFTTDLSGNLLYASTGNQRGYCQSIHPIDTGGYLLTMNFYLYGGGSNIPFAGLFKFNNQCKIVNNTTFSYVSGLFNAGCQAGDGAITYTGGITDPHGSLLLMKTEPNMTVNYPSPVDSITITGSTRICEGDSVKLSVTGNYVGYQWYVYAHNPAGYGIYYYVLIDGADSPVFYADSSSGYLCMMYDGNNNTYLSNIVNVTMVKPGSPILSLSGNPIHCAVDDTISISGPYTNLPIYDWMFNGNSLMMSNYKITPLLSGDYYLKITDVCGVFHSDTITVQSNARPILNPLPDTVKLTTYVSNGVCSINVLDPAASNVSAFSWHFNGIPNGNTASKDTVNSAGLYYVVVSNSCGSINSNITVVEYDTVKLTYDKSPTGCSNSSLRLTAPYGYSYYSWYKNGNYSFSTTNNYIIPGVGAGLDSGSYKCDFYVDCNGIGTTVFTDSVYYRENNTITPSVTYAPGTSFCTGNPVALYLSSVSGITGGYQWFLNNIAIPSASGQSYNANQTGFYKCQFNMGCGINSTNQTYLKFGPPDTTYYIENIYDRHICQGQPNNSTVSLRVNVPQEVQSSCTFQWKYFSIDIAGQTSTYHTAAQAGYYTLQLTNSCGSYTTPLYYVRSVAQPQNTVTPAGTVQLCKGDSVTFNIAATPNFTYQWYQNNSPALGYTGTSYVASTNSTVYTQMKSYGCVYYSTFSQLNLLNPNVVTLFNHSPLEVCGNDSVLISANQIPNVTYSWYYNGSLIAGNTSDKIYATLPGEIRASVTANPGCTSQSFPLVVRTGNSSNVSISSSYYSYPCYGDSITLSVSNTFSSYQWYKNGIALTGATSNNLVVTQQGLYRIEITQSGGCVGYASKQVTYSPDTLIKSISAVPSICGNNKGSFTVYFNDVTTWDVSGPGGYVQSGVVTNAFSPLIINSLSSGWYYLSCSYAGSGCMYSDSVYVPSLNTIPVSFTYYPDSVECLGSRISLFSSFTPSGYTYLWSDSSINSYLLLTVSGIYTLTVTDTVTGCSGTSSVNISFINPPLASITSSASGVICSTDTVQLSATPGTFNYLWNNGVTSSTLSTHIPGVYVVTITDTLTGCFAKDTVFINPTPTIIINKTIYNVTCNSLCNGNIFTSTGGGVGNFLFNWNSGLSTQPDLFNLCPGTYSLLVTDSAGCFTRDTSLITQPLPFSSNVVLTNNSCASCCDGVSVVNVTGGTLPYSYLWNNGLSTAYDSTLCNGIFNVLITDANGCTDSLSFSLTTDVKNALYQSGFLVFPVPSTNFLFIKTKTPRPFVKVQLVNYLGELLRTQQYENIAENETISIDLSGILPQSLLLIIDDNVDSKKYRIVKL